MGGVTSSLQGGGPPPVDPRGQVGQLGVRGGATPARRSLEAMVGVIGGHEGVRELPHHSSDSPAGPTPVIFPFGEVLEVGRMDGPEVAFSVFTAACLDEALVQGEVVSDTVPPIFVLWEKFIKMSPNASKLECNGALLGIGNTNTNKYRPHGHAHIGMHKTQLTAWLLNIPQIPCNVILP